MGETTIEWTDAVWNPTTGCTKVSPGCKHCYAERIFPRAYSKYEVPAGGGDLNGPFMRARRFTDVQTHVDRLDAPLHWKKPRRIFVNSMSDLFHEDVPFEFIDKVFAVMALATHHTFQVLTKRSARMREYFGKSAELDGMTRDVLVEGEAQNIYQERTGEDPSMWLAVHWPLPNVWLGVSVEDQPRADLRIPDLCNVPAAVRFLSCEPLLASVNLFRELIFDANGNIVGPGHPWLDYIAWVIVGGESGPKARPFYVEWARSIKEQCRDSQTPVFVKQLGAFVIDRNDAGFDGCDPTSWPLRSDGSDPVLHFEPFGYVELAQGAACRIRLEDRKGGNWAEWPEDLRIREFPTP